MIIKLTDLPILGQIISIFPELREVKQKILNQETVEVQITALDTRSHTAEQRRQARALCGEIAKFYGYDNQEMYDNLKYDFCTQYVCDYFSMRSDSEYGEVDFCSVTLARKFREYLVGFCLYNRVPTKKPLLDYTDNGYKYFYGCVEHGVCSICGNPTSELHHVDTVGMGFNRQRVNHGGKRAVQLCSTHHSEAHQIGLSRFSKRYVIEFIKLDKYLCEVRSIKY